MDTIDSSEVMGYACCDDRPTIIHRLFKITEMTDHICDFNLKKGQNCIYDYENKMIIILCDDKDDDNHLLSVMYPFNLLNNTHELIVQDQGNYYLVVDE